MRRAADRSALRAPALAALAVAGAGFGALAIAPAAARADEAAKPSWGAGPAAPPAAPAAAASRPRWSTPAARQPQAQPRAAASVPARRAAAPAAPAATAAAAPAATAAAAPAATAAAARTRARPASAPTATAVATATGPSSRPHWGAAPGTAPAGSLADGTESAGMMLAADRRARPAGRSSDRQTERRSERQSGWQPDRPAQARQPVTFAVPLIDVTSQLAEVPVTLMPDNTILVQTEPLLDGLRRTLEPVAVERLEAVIRGRASVAPQDLAEAGLTLRWNAERYVLEIDIPAPMRRVRNISLADAGVASALEPTVEPARLSAYLNADTAVAGDLEGNGGTTASVQMNGAVRFGGVVLEGEASYASTGPEDTRFQRLGTRVVYDDRARSLRWTLGDVAAPSRGFQGGFSTGGLAVFRNYAQLQPQQLLRRQGEREFTLLRESTVEAYLNNRVVQRFRLAPGTYNLSDIPLGNGVNDVRLLITDDTGNQDSVEFNLFLDRTLLEPGRSEFAVAAGVGRTLDGGQLRYDDRSWSVTGSYRQGITERLTLGANLQSAFEPETGPADGGSDRTTSLVGAEAFVASPVGQIGVDVAASRREGRFTADDREGEGYAVNASLTASLGSGGDGGAGALGGQSVALVYEYRSADFAVPGSGPVSNPFSSRFGASWSLSLADAGYLTIDARHAIGRDSTTDESSASVSYGRRLFGSMSLSASAILTRSAGADDFAWRIGLIRRIGREASAQIEYDGASETTRLSLQHARGSGVGSTSTALALDHAQGRSGVTATGSYIGNRFQAGANLNRIESGFGSSGTRLALRLGTALVHADGATALSRPVSDSFAILVPHPTLAGSQVRMGQANATADAMSGVWGGAVDSRLSAFSPRRLVYSVPDAPAGYDIGTGEVIVSPLYRSGYRVVIGSDYTLTVLGRLMGPNGEPRALVAGELREQDGPGREPVLLLTNREGVFGVSGLRPGAWVLTFPGDETTSYLLTVPGSGESIVRIGDVLPVVVRHVAGRTP